MSSPAESPKVNCADCITQSISQFFRETIRYRDRDDRGREIKLQTDVSKRLKKVATKVELSNFTNEIFNYTSYGLNNGIASKIYSEAYLNATVL